MEEIAEAADVSRRTFFNHFPTKNDAFIPDLGVLPPGALTDFGSRRTPGLIDAIEQLVLARAELLGSILDDNGASMRVVHDNPELHPLLMAQVREFELAVREASASRFDTSDTSLEVLTTASLVISLERAVLEAWRVSPRGSELADLVHPAIESLRRAIST